MSLFRAASAPIRCFGTKPLPRVAIAGATGAVGVELLQLLEERNFPLSSLKLLASSRSAGTYMTFKGEQVMVEELKDDSFRDVDIALFSAGGSQTKKYAPLAVKDNCVVVDNSSAYRMDPNTPLVIPEINPEDIKWHSGILANPNCSTIIMAMVVFPLHQVSPVDRIIASTYQAASGAGAAAMRELEEAAHSFTKGESLQSEIFGRQYLWNCFSHNSDMDLESGYNEEELKMINETHKIFHDDSIGVTATCIRVPILRAHSEAINISFKDSMTVAQACDILNAAPGVSLIDDRVNNVFPEPINASGLDDCFVGRIRQDRSLPEGKGLSLFVCGDQIRKGAALNAIQIAELL
jgi:aspartate-semialdehyde dehydrogenase